MMLNSLFCILVLALFATTTDVSGAAQKKLRFMSTATITRFPTKYPTMRPTLRPSAFPSKFPTVRPTRKPTALPTAMPTALPTAMPTALPTAMPTALPTNVIAAPSTCNAYSSSACASKPGCKWTSSVACTYTSHGKSCNTFTYMCQPSTTFCNFNKGNDYERMYQCSMRGSPCKWNTYLKACQLGTPAPTRPKVARTVCTNSCFPFNRNRRCEDGGAGSKSTFCLLGTDCADCGPRTIYM